MPIPGDAGDERLDAALAALREADREVLRLWAWEQLETRQIAAVLGISANAASIRLHRARTRLTRLVDGGRTGKTRPLPGHGPDDRREDVR